MRWATLLTGAGARSVNLVSRPRACVRCASRLATAASAVTEISSSDGCPAATLSAQTIENLAPAIRLVDCLSRESPDDSARYTDAAGTQIGLLSDHSSFVGVGFMNSAPMENV
jgi:hypothetical protein